MLTSWNPLGHSRPVTELLYLLLRINYNNLYGMNNTEFVNAQQAKAVY